MRKTPPPYKVSDFTKNLYMVKEVAAFLGVTPKTIRDYDLDGRLPAERTPGGKRRISRQSLLAFLDAMGVLSDDSKSEKRDVIYARVSSHEQKAKGDLDRQVVNIVENSKSLQNPLILMEVGSGMNDRRKELARLIRLVMDGSVRNVHVTYRDRLTRFGFNLLKEVFTRHGVEIICVHQEEDDRDASKELVDDMMSLLASFSGKLYGMRSKRGRKHENPGNI